MWAVCEIAAQKEGLNLKYKFRGDQYKDVILIHDNMKVLSRKYREEKKTRQNMFMGIMSCYMALTFDFFLKSIEYHIQFLSEVPSSVPNCNLCSIFQVPPLACF